MCDERISMIKCYHFISDYRVGGQHVYVDVLRKALKGKVKQVVVTTGCGAMTDIGLFQLRHYWKPLYALEILVNTMLIMGLVYTARVKRNGSVFHVHGGANVAPIIAARIMNIPVVWTIHETITSYQLFVKLGRWLLKHRSHYLVIVAEASRRAFVGFDKATLIPGAVDDVFWSYNQVSVHPHEEAWNNLLQEKGEKPLRILSVGNLNPLKGADILLSSLSMFDEPWVLNIVGMPLATQQEYAQQLNEAAAKLMHGSVSFLGWQSAEQVRSLLAGCDVFVLPSRSEACPIALLEAMAMGCYCIASDVGDVRTMLAGYKRSAVFSAAKPDELLALLKAYQLADSASFERNRTGSVGAYSMEAMAASYKRIYSLLAQI